MNPQPDISDHNDFNRRLSNLPQELKDRILDIFFNDMIVKQLLKPTPVTAIDHPNNRSLDHWEINPAGHAETYSIFDRYLRYSLTHVKSYIHHLLRTTVFSFPEPHEAMQNFSRIIDLMGDPNHPDAPPVQLDVFLLRDWTADDNDYVDCIFTERCYWPEIHHDGLHAWLQGIAWLSMQTDIHLYMCQPLDHYLGIYAEYDEEWAIHKHNVSYFQDRNLIVWEDLPAEASPAQQTITLARIDGKDLSRHIKNCGRCRSGYGEYEKTAAYDE